MGPEPFEPGDDRLDLDDPALVGVVAAILDGTPIDWKTAESGATPDNQAAIRQLRILAEVAALHRVSPAPETDASDRTHRVEPDSRHALGRWGSLTLLEQIGQGAFGDVFRAWDPRLDREVALKLLRPVVDQSTDGAVASVEEGRLLARVRHPNVITVYGAERINGQVGLWTEFIHGRTLAQLVREHGRYSAQEATSIGLDLCRALSAVDRAGLLHRDIKAQNVMREEGGRTVLMDFGAGREQVARAVGGAAELTGTPLYLAPELWEGAEATRQSDIYSLGVLLYHLATGAYPVRGATMEAVRAAHRAGRRTLLRDERPDLPDAFVDAIEGALAQKPSDRYESAGSFEAALKKAQATSAAVAAESSRKPLASVARPPRDKRWALWTLAAVITATVVFIALELGGFRLSSLGGSPRRPPATTPAADVASPTTRKRTDRPKNTGWEGRPSADGRFIPYVDGEGGDVWLWDLATGATRQVTKHDPASDEYANGPVAISPDDERIAYVWLTLDGAHELRVIRADGSGVRVAIARDTADFPIPVEWSHDGTEILCALQQKDGSMNLALAATGEGGAPPRTLQTFRTNTPSNVSLSPDSRFVVYDLAREERPFSQHDLFIVGTDGSPARILLEHPANDLFPLWTPDGEHVFFSSDRSGSMEGWLVAVADGVAQGEPAVVAWAFAGVRPIGFTDEGALYYELNTSSLEAYTQSVDLTGATAPGQPARVAPAEIGGHVNPSWSRDGLRLVYISTKPILSKAPALGGRLDLIPKTLTIQDVQTGNRREIVPKLANLALGPPQWAPDDLSVLVKGTDLRNQLGYFRVDVETGKTVPVRLNGTATSESDFGGIHWAPYDQAFFFVYGPVGIFRYDLDTNSETVIVDKKKIGIERIPGFGVSPNGRSMAFGFATAQGKDQKLGLMVQTDGGPAREVFSVRFPELLFFQKWTPDGLDLLFTRFRDHQTADTDPHQLWVVPASGGPARDTNERINGYTHQRPVAVSPGGNRIAFSTGETSSEIWMMENFLPAPAGRTRR